MCKTISSEQVSEFVKNVLQLKNEYKVAEANLSLADKRTCDFQHYLEFGLCDDKMLEEFTQNLRARRGFKDQIYLSVPLIDWIEKNNKAFGSLAQVIGEMRKREKQLANRIYTPRVVENDDLAHMNYTAYNGEGE